MREVKLWKLLVNEILHLGGEIVEQFSGVSVPSLPVTEKCFASRQADIGVGIIEQIFQVLADGQTKGVSSCLGHLANTMMRYWAHFSSSCELRYNVRDECKNGRIKMHMCIGMLWVFATLPTTSN